MQRVLRAVVQGHIEVPPSEHVGPCERSFILGFLNRDPQQRLGAQGGHTEIITHPFFAGWNLFPADREGPVPGTRPIDERHETPPGQHAPMQQPHQQMSPVLMSPVLSTAERRNRRRQLLGYDTPLETWFAAPGPAPAGHGGPPHNPLAAFNP